MQQTAANGFSADFVGHLPITDGDLAKEAAPASYEELQCRLDLHLDTRHNLRCHKRAAEAHHLARAACHCGAVRHAQRPLGSAVGLGPDARALGGARLVLAVTVAVRVCREWVGGAKQGKGGATRWRRGAGGSRAGSPDPRHDPCWATRQTAHPCQPRTHPCGSACWGRGSPCRPPRRPCCARWGWLRAPPGACRTRRTCLTAPAPRCSSRTPGGGGRA